MPRATIVLTGDKKLNRKLRKLKGPLGKKAIREAARPPMRNIILPETKALAPERSGLLKKKLKVRALPRSRRRVGVRVTVGEGDFAGETFYAGFQEWGWQLGKRGGTRGRKIKGKFFMWRAAKNKRTQVLSMYRRLLGRKIEELARRG